MASEHLRLALELGTVVNCRVLRQAAETLVEQAIRPDRAVLLNLAATLGHRAMLLEDAVAGLTELDRRQEAGGGL